MHQETNSFIHRYYSEFTNDLRILMKKYPSLPVVPIISGAGAKNLVASIAYIHDKNNEFVERCIAITDRIAETDTLFWFDIDDALPFT